MPSLNVSIDENGMCSIRSLLDIFYVREGYYVLPDAEVFLLLKLITLLFPLYSTIGPTVFARECYNCILFCD
jgi:hypothetical protein